MAMPVPTQAIDVMSLTPMAQVVVNLVKIQETKKLKNIHLVGMLPVHATVSKSNPITYLCY